MLKIADVCFSVKPVTLEDLDECDAKPKNDLVVDLAPGIKDLLLTAITFLCLAYFAIVGMESWYPFNWGLVFLAGAYSLNILEDHTQIIVGKLNKDGLREITITKSKFHTILKKEYKFMTDEVMDIVLAEKDLRMRNNFAYRLEFKLESGCSIPLTHSFIINENIIKAMRELQEKLLEFIEQ
ncbi:hypothetical protein MP638_000954 [Amoeboaphelidium occidentale]|nr:hypothetical protein MP638_000954 [Amoeboaphelidium occidentale]